MREELAAAQQWIRHGEGAVLARVTRVVGSAPRPVGSAMVISSGNRFSGSVSGGCVEGAIIQSAEGVLRDGKAIMLDFSGDGDPLTEIVLGCGGEASIFLERLDKDGALSPVFAAFLDRFSPDDDGWLMTRCDAIPAHWLLDSQGAVIAADVDDAPDPAAFAQHIIAPVKLIIVGADAVGQAVAEYAHLLGWPVTVIDPRGAWLSPMRFPHARRVMEWPDEALPAMTLDERTAMVVLSHDPKIDEAALKVALRSNAGYIGALGSRRAHADRLTRLQASGMTTHDLEKLQAPVGLDLGGRSPAEMALSIVAEIVALHNRRHGGQLRLVSGPIHEAESLPSLTA
jgi:xanthine dehydrogenase accessory factor